MTTIIFDNKEVQLEDNESVLDGLLRVGEDINYGCRSGLCQSCLLETKDGEVPAHAQKGLSDQQKTLGYALACQCVPSDPITFNSIDSDKLKVSGRILDKTWLNDSVIRLRIETDIEFMAGQYFTLWKDETIGRSYSIASLPDEGFIECHIKHYPDGELSAWAGEALQVSDTVSLQGPMGSCIYTATPDQPMIMAAMGTGLAPIYGLLKEALKKGHAAPIQVMVAAKESQSFYLSTELEELAKQHDQLSIQWFSLDSESEDSRDVYEYAKTRKDLGGYKVYLCGGENFVKKMRKTFFLAGAGMQDIVADTFTQFSK